MRDAETAGRRPFAAPWSLSRDARVRVALTSALLGVAATAVALVAGAPAAAVMVPASIGAAIALAVVPFPAADRLLALGLMATFPLLPPLGLPNLPLSAAVLLIAAARLTFEEGLVVARRVLVVLSAFWGLLVVGVLLADWPPLSVMARPAVLLGLAAVGSYVGALVWVDAGRRMRWLEGLIVGSIVVTSSAIGVFVLQYVAPIPDIVDRLAEALGYVRGEGAANKFDARNNWLIQGGGVTLRAISPFVPGPTNLGGYLGIVGSLTAAYWLVTRGSAYRTLGMFAGGLAITTGIVTYSRSSWVSGAAAILMAGLLLVAIRRLRRDPAWPPLRQLMAAVLVAVLALVLGVAGLATSGSQRAAERITNASDDPSVTSRVDSDVRAFGRLVADPIRGYGLGNWSGATDEALAAADPTATPYIHNAYLDFGGATGVFGLAWVIAIIGLLLVAGGWLAAKGPPRGSRLVGLALVMVGVFTGVQFLFDDNTRNPQYAALLMWTLGGGLALADASRTRHGPPDPVARCGSCT
jgi:hypothetical protein